MILGNGSLWNWIFTGRLFLVSYAPLAGIFAARFSPQWYITVPLATLAAWGIIDGFRIIRGARKRARSEVKINHIEDQGSAVSGYLATYLLPFLGSLPASIGDVIAFFLYFIVAFIVFAKSDLALINPTLYALGWRVYRVEVNDKKFLLLATHATQKGDRLQVHRLRGEVLVADTSVSQ